MFYFKFRRLIQCVAVFAGSVLPVFASSKPDSVAVPFNGKATPMPDAVGLVLSGGGAKGIAHIGVIKALEDNDIPIDCITGTSMGAIVGGLYAMGYTPEKMMALIESKPFGYWSTGQIDSDLTYYFLQNEVQPALIDVSLGKGGSKGYSSLSSVLPASLINPIPMNFAFIELFTPYTAQCGGDFNKLMVPFRCVASDVDLKRKAVFWEGDLGDCIRASMSFPLVFHPIEIDGRPMYDGGIYDNFPVDVMIDDFNPEIILGVDVSSGNTPDEPNANMMDQLEALIMQESNYQVPSERGMRLKMDLDRFGLLDFDKAREIYKIGYDYAMSKMDSIKIRVHRRRGAAKVDSLRRSFNSRTPELLFDSVKVSGGTHAQNDYISYLFTHNRPDTITVDRARDAYYRAITPGKISNLVPRAVYDKADGMFTLDLDATVKNDFNVAVGGYLTTTTNSMLYLSGAYRTLSLNSLDMSVSGWIGQSYLAAQASAKIQLLRSVPSSLGIQAVASRQKYFPSDSYFFHASDPTVLQTDTYFGRLTYGVAVGRWGKADISLGMGHINDKCRPTAQPSERDEISGLSRSVAQAAVRFEHSTLNTADYPTAGHHSTVTLEGNLVNYSLEDASGNKLDIGMDHKRGWGLLKAAFEDYRPLHKNFTLGTAFTAVATTDKLLPDYYTSIAASPAYVPSATVANLLAASFRAHQFAAFSVRPIWVISQLLQVRSNFDFFLPYRTIQADTRGMAVPGRPWHNPQFFGEIRGVARFKFASVSAYAHYSTAPEGHWNFGLTFGLYIPAPSFF